MNAYLIDGGEIRVVNDVVDGWYVYDYADSVELVFADNRGQAKATYIKHYAHDRYCCHEFEYTDPQISIRLIAKNVNRSRGVAQYDDILRTQVDPEGFAQWLAEEPEAVSYYRDYPVQISG